MKAMATVSATTEQEHYNDKMSKSSIETNSTYEGSIISPIDTSIENSYASNDDDSMSIDDNQNEMVMLFNLEL